MRKVLAVLPLLAGCAMAHAAAPAAPPRILAVFAHPDDEIVVAPALAAAARRGAQVRIVYATAGDAAASQMTLAPGSAIAERRSAEARCASAALGLAEPVILTFGDGTLGTVTRPPGDRLAWLRESIVQIMKDAPPDIVVTWGPDGGYGHPDHRLVSAVVTELLASRGERPLLLHAALPAGSIPPVPELNAWSAVAPDLLTVRVTYAPADQTAAAKAVQCHTSQFSAVIRDNLVPLFAGSVWKDGVAFRAPLDRASGSDLLALHR